MQGNLPLSHISSFYLKCIEQFQQLDQMLQFSLFFIVYPLIGISGLLLNFFIMSIIPRRSVLVSRSTKIYFIIAAIGDSLIMVKNVSLFLIKLSCHLSGRKFCSHITFANTVWKTLMILWLDGEILSNYSLLFLSAERLASALDSHHHPRKSYSLAFVFRVVYPIILATLVIYNLPIGLLLLKVENDAQAPSGAILAIERNSTLLNRLSILTKFLTVTAPVIGTLFASYLLLKKIQK